MHPILRRCTALAALTVAACVSDAPLGPTALTLDATAGESRDGAKQLGFLSRNLYIGTDLSVVVQALASTSRADDIPALLGAIADIKATDWPARVVAIADEIEAAKPQVIGLQEAWDINVNLTPLGLAVTLDLDFLASLQAELASRGLDYEVAATFQGVSAAPLPGISVIDRDLILVDATRVTVDEGSIVSQAFAANIGTVAAGVVVKRGWVALSGRVDGEQLRIVSTHLESGAGAALTQLRAYQAGQLMVTLASAPRAVVMGDFNDTPTSPMHAIVTRAGFADAWLDLRPGVEGLTCCHDEVLANDRSQDSFDQRIDYVFVRGLAASNGQLQGRITMLGANATDRLQGASWMIWPSDHAGLALEILVTPAR